MLKATRRALALTVCCLVLWGVWRVHWAWEPILHNGTNRDDDTARMVLGLALGFGFLAFLVVFFTVLNSIMEFWEWSRTHARTLLRALKPGSSR